MTVPDGLDDVWTWTRGAKKLRFLGAPATLCTWLGPGPWPACYAVGSGVAAAHWQGTFSGKKMNPFSIVADFERVIAEYAGARFAVAVDTGTVAIFLACRYIRVRTVSLPRRTFCSVPCSVIHAGGRVCFDERKWRGAYSLDPYPIIDAACRFHRGMYESYAVKNTYWCMSFQYRKHLPIGRGGMILTNDEEAYRWFKLARFSGRHERPMRDDTPEMIGWQCYMEPERAARGLTLMLNMADYQEDLQFEYPDLSTFGLYDLPVGVEQRDGSGTPRFPATFEGGSGQQSFASVSESFRSAVQATPRN